MKILSLISAILLFITVPGCARNMYEGLRQKQQMDCSNLQGADRDECLKRTGMSYDEYQRQLREREQKK